MSGPRVSVVLSSLNHAQFVGEAIQSVLDQTYRDFELFVIDDCSGDNSWEVIRNFSDPRIVAVRNEVRSRGAYGFNEIIRRRAKGEYIAIHHSDDVWLPTKLEKQVEFLDRHPSVGAVFTSVGLIDEEGGEFLDPDHYYQTAFEQKNRTRFEWLRYFFLHGNCLCHPSVVARRQVMLDAGLYDRRLGQITDFDLWVRICIRHDIHILDEVLTRFRIRAGNANQSGETRSMFVRSRNEWPVVLGRLLAIDNEEIFFAIFPEMRAVACSVGRNNLRFLLAMRAVRADGAFRIQFGLSILYSLMADETTVAELKEKYDFGYGELVDLAADMDSFQGTELSHLVGHLRALQDEIARIKQSFSWRATAPFRAVWYFVQRLGRNKLRSTLHTPGKH